MNKHYKHYSSNSLTAVLHSRRGVARRNSPISRRWHLLQGWRRVSVFGVSAFVHRVHTLALDPLSVAKSLKDFRAVVDAGACEPRLLRGVIFAADRGSIMLVLLRGSGRAVRPVGLFVMGDVSHEESSRLMRRLIVRTQSFR